MSTALFWFRNDLRLHDQIALQTALQSGAQHLVPVYCHQAPDQATDWGFDRIGAHRQAWTHAAVQDLASQLSRLGCPLLECTGPASKILPEIARAAGAQTIVCEQIAAPYEQEDVTALQAAGLTVHTVWQSSLLDPADLPWPASELPASFTPFKQAIERAGIQPPKPLPRPDKLPPWPTGTGAALEAFDAFGALNARGAASTESGQAREPLTVAASDPRSSFPYTRPDFNGGETAALAHLRRYLAQALPHTYKQTRNDLTGVNYSSKWSPWLATGAISARQIMSELRTFEAQHGASESSYWLWFELLWRDYFRFLHLQHGRKLYRPRGLSPDVAKAQRQPSPSGSHNAQGFVRWCEGRTGEPLVDAAMRELAATGFLSNRLRQIVASYLINELGGDWRAGAAWFESQLLDYDPYSNQGNWLYIAGHGTDPRGGRHFNIERQTRQYDPGGHYQRLWGNG